MEASPTISSLVCSPYSCCIRGISVYNELTRPYIGLLQQQLYLEAETGCVGYRNRDIPSKYLQPFRKDFKPKSNIHRLMYLYWLERYPETVAFCYIGDKEGSDGVGPRHSCRFNVAETEIYNRYFPLIPPPVVGVVIRERGQTGRSEVDTSIVYADEERLPYSRLPIMGCAMDGDNGRIKVEVTFVDGEYVAYLVVSKMMDFEKLLEMGPNAILTLGNTLFDAGDNGIVYTVDVQDRRLVEVARLTNIESDCERYLEADAFLKDMELFLASDRRARYLGVDWDGTLAVKRPNDTLIDLLYSRYSNMIDPLNISLPSHQITHEMKASWLRDILGSEKAHYDQIFTERKLPIPIRHEMYLQLIERVDGEISLGNISNEEKSTMIYEALQNIQPPPELNNCLNLLRHMDAIVSNTQKTELEFQKMISKVFEGVEPSLWPKQVILSTEGHKSVIEA